MRTFGAVLFVFGVGVISIAVYMVAAAVSGGAGTVGMIDSMNSGIVVPAFIAVIAGIPVALLHETLKRLPSLRGKIDHFHLL